MKLQIVFTDIVDTYKSKSMVYKRLLPCVITVIWTWPSNKENNFCYWHFWFQYLYLINIYELILVCLSPRNVWVFSETTYSSQTKLIGLNLHVSEHGIGYSILTPDPQGAQGAPGVKIQVSPNQKTSLTKVVRHDKGMIKISSAPPEELGKPAKRVS